MQLASIVVTSTKASLIYLNSIQKEVGVDYK